MSAEVSVVLYLNSWDCLRISLVLDVNKELPFDGSSNFLLDVLKGMTLMSVRTLLTKMLS